MTNLEKLELHMKYKQISKAREHQLSLRAEHVYKRNFICSLSLFQLFYHPVYNFKN